MVHFSRVESFVEIILHLKCNDWTIKQILFKKSPFSFALSPHLSFCFRAILSTIFIILSTSSTDWYCFYKLSWYGVFLWKRSSRLRSTFRFFLFLFRYDSLCNNLVIEINLMDIIFDSAVITRKIVNVSSHLCITLLIRMNLSLRDTVTINILLFNWSVVLLYCILYRLFFALILSLVPFINLLRCLFSSVILFSPFCKTSCFDKTCHFV